MLYTQHTSVRYVQQPGAGYAQQVGAVHVQPAHAGKTQQVGAGMAFTWNRLPTQAFPQPEPSHRGVPAAYTLLSIDS